MFETKVNETLLANAVYTYLSNQRQANAHTKDRSEVSGGGKKPWKQKGTGRARHGSSRSPIWTGGGVTFGPTNERNYKKKLNKKARQEAIRCAFSAKNDAKEVIVIDDFKPEKTKEVEKVLKNLGVKGNVTFVQIDEQGLHAKSKNIKNAKAVRVGELNAYEILNNNMLVLLKSSLDEISKRWGKESTKKSTKK